MAKDVINVGAIGIAVSDVLYTREGLLAGTPYAGPIDKVVEGETLVAEATEVAREGRAGVTRVAVRTAGGRIVAEFTGYSRTLGGAVAEI